MKKKIKPTKPKRKKTIDFNFVCFHRVRYHCHLLLLAKKQNLYRFIANIISFDLFLAGMSVSLIYLFGMVFFASSCDKLSRDMNVVVANKVNTTFGWINSFYSIKTAMQPTKNKKKVNESERREKKGGQILNCIR